MVSAIFKTDNYQLARKMLDATALRQEAIATNVANAETPGYRRLDVSADFTEALRNQLAAGGLADGAPSIRPKLVEDANARTLRPDGNTVEIDSELLSMNRNALEHQYLTDVVSNNLKQLRMAITGRVI